MDFSLIIKEQHQDIDEEKNMSKKWYSGFLTLLNLTVNNGTHDISLIYNEQIHEYINKINNKYEKNFRILDEVTDSKITSNEKEACFIKLNFYENGDIKDIFIPEEFYLPNMVHIEAIIKLIIPKLSTNLYSNNITEEVIQIDKLATENIDYDDDDEEEEEENSIINSSDFFEDDNEESKNSENHLNEYLSDSDETDNLNEKEKNNFLRRNSENGTDDEISENEKNKVQPEIEYVYSSIEDQKYHLKGIDENETFSNITDFEMESLDGTQAKLEGSNLRRIKNTFIDEKGMISSIIEYEYVTICQPNKEIVSELTEEEDKLKTEIYNENNQIPREDGEDFMGKNISFDISDIKIENMNNVSFYNKIDNEEFARNLFKYFDNFIYIKYNQTENEDLNLRFLKFKEELQDDYIKENNINISKVEIEHSKLTKKQVRNLQYTNTYYGMKNFVKEKILFKYNLIGLILEGIIVTNIDVSSGVTKNYFKLTLGFISFKIKFSTIETNLHIIIKNSNQMTYNFMALLSKSNEELIKRNDIYSGIIIDLEKNVSNLLNNYYDYSGLFRDSLEFLYDKVKNFSGTFFNELIQLIENVYDNYTIILNQTENDEFEILNNIRNATKNEYINYINNMFNIILNFENDTLIFLGKIQYEVDNIQSFKLDILYDIIDAIYDGKLIFKEFIKKLFKAVERGVTTFKYDIRDYMEEIIGNLLYLTDFLSININKNEILKNAIALEKRQSITWKLKNFRNIIIRIIEILNDNIINDYEEEMSSSNENSIKFDKENLIQQCFEDIDDKSNKVIEEIKIKIQFMNYYETYAENIDVINEITNKTFIEFNYDLSNNILKDITKISPEYLDKNSDLIKNKNSLFSLSKDIANQINNEIKEINKKIELYSDDYINENNYNFDYNLNHFKEYFSNDFLKSLINEFKSIVKEALQIHYIQIINNNYDLLYEYFEEIQAHFIKAPSQKLLGTVFINSYTNCKAIFQEMSFLTSSDEFLNYIEENFFDVSNYVLNYVNEKIDSINKYYFNQLYNDNFYKFELINSKIQNIISNLNNYFNEIVLNNDIKQIIINITMNEIQTLNSEKEKKFDDLYNDIYGMAQGQKIYNSKCEIIKLRIVKKRKWY